MARHLFYLVVELKLKCRHRKVWVQLMHISGKRMIAFGLDGILGYDLHQYISVNLVAFELQGPRLKEWCEGWMDKDYSPPLEMAGWFWEGHQTPTWCLYLGPTSCESIGGIEGHRCLEAETSLQCHTRVFVSTVVVG